MVITIEPIVSKLSRCHNISSVFTLSQALCSVGFNSQLISTFTILSPLFLFFYPLLLLQLFVYRYVLVYIDVYKCMQVNVYIRTYIYEYIQIVKYLKDDQPGNFLFDLSFVMITDTTQ